jgi:UDP-2,3-diacylglucosamine pyrophosphatase LpxH
MQSDITITSKTAAEHRQLDLQVTSFDIASKMNDCANAVSQVRTLFLSDMHLGATGSRADLALALLQATHADKYVLVGDIVDLWHPGPSQWGADEQAIIEHIRARHREGAEIVYISGNHDPDPQAAFDTGLLPVRAKTRTVHVTADGRQFLVLHGDDAESRLLQSRALTRMGSWAERKLRSLDNWIATYFERTSIVQRSVIEYLLSNINWLLYYTLGHEVRLVDRSRDGGYQGVICGHFHLPALHKHHGLIYANCGDWRDSFTALTEGHDGQLNLIGGRK